MEPFAEYEEYDAVGLAELVAAGDVHPRALVEAAIIRIEERNPAINAVIRTHFQAARSLADQPVGNGPFAGVPTLIKDLAMQQGERVSFGSVFFREYSSDHTSEVLQRIQATGLIALGRTSTPEFGLLPTTEPYLHAPTNNPWNVEHSPGGSSGGAAAAVAARIVPLAHGSDGGGSIRIPASACGVFGFKPSRGRVPRLPASPADYLSVDLGLSLSVRDSAALLDAISGPAPGDAYMAPPPSSTFLDATQTDPEGLRIAFTVADFRGERVHPECERAVMRTAGLLEQLGHQVVEERPDIDGPAMTEAFLEVWAGLAAGIFHLILEEADKRMVGRLLRRTLGDWWAMRTIAFLDGRKAKQAAFEPFTWSLADQSRHSRPARLDAATTRLQDVSHRLAAFMKRCDVFLTPVLGMPPVRTGEIDQDVAHKLLSEQLTRYVAFTPLANFTGVPAMSVPIHWSGDGLPIGSHFIGRFGDEETLLRLAGQIERAKPWRRRVPDMASARDRE